jgi:hypothetical protein
MIFVQETLDLLPPTYHRVLFRAANITAIVQDNKLWAKHSLAIFVMDKYFILLPLYAQLYRKRKTVLGCDLYVVSHFKI